MSGLRLFTGNRLETLSIILADTLKASPLPPLQQDLFVVQSNGMERWVSMEIAKHLGVSANNRFLYPNTFIQDMMGRVVMTDEDRSDFSPEVLTWRIMRRLPACLDNPSFEEIRYYLGDSLWDRKYYQLASKIADVYDQYLVFRPEMIHRWETGEDKSWQAELWRQLVDEAKEKRGAYHKAHLLNQFIGTLRKSQKGAFEFPDRISVFGISALPQFHMSVLDALSATSDVYLYLLNPCREYWGDILSEKEKKKVSEKKGAASEYRSLLHLEAGNRLLSDLGVLGRDFFDLIQDVECETQEFFEEPGESGLLSCIQSDILNLADRRDRGQKKTISNEDHSVMIHSCHSPMREVEILYDHLLDLFNNDPSLIPGDILVMTPDIENYTPFIQAVFDVPEDEEKRIPYSIADRTVLNESPVIRAFNSLLGFCGSRFGISQVLSFLEISPVRSRFDFNKNDMALIEKWVTDTGIKWGIDAGHRGTMTLPELDENTWRFGLRQLLLGYAMKSRREKTFLGIYPYDELEGEVSLIMGRFVHFAEKLFDVALMLEKPRPAVEWTALLNVILDEFFLPEPHLEKDFQMIRRALDGLKEVSLAAGVGENVGLDIIRQHLANLFGKQGFGFGFLEGGVTFCAMVPMRSIPFKVICLIGINNDAYPRQTRSPGFDLIAKTPRKGDRSRRNDDRYLFLESILSARQVLYISYVGQSRIDNSTIPPAVPVSGLMEYIDENYETKDAPIRHHLVKTHRLQAFNSDYFNSGGELFSYSEENKKVSEDLTGKEKTSPRFIPQSDVNHKGGIRENICHEVLQEVDLEDFMRFFSNPSEYFINHRLGFYFDKTPSLLEEREVFRLDPLDKYFMEKELIDAVLDQRRPMDVIDVFRAAGRLPHGKVGKIVFNNMVREATDFAEHVLSFLKDKPADPAIIDMPINGIRLTGGIEGFDGSRTVMYRNATIKAKDLLRLWISHLAINCIDDGSTGPYASIFVGRDGAGNISVIEARPEETCFDILGRLIEHYKKGLESPLHFFPETSMHFAKQVATGNKTRKEALQGAIKKWDGSDYSPGESDNPYYELCFRGLDPFAGDFEPTAMDIFTPLLVNMRL